MTAKVNAVKLEIVGLATSTVQPISNARTLKAEVVGASFAEQRSIARGNAIKTEVVVSAIRRTKGFDLPAIAVEAFTLFVVFKPRNWTAPGDLKQLSLLHTDPQHGIFLRKAAGSTIELYMRYGETGEISAICPVPSYDEGLIASIAFNPATLETLFRINGVGPSEAPAAAGDWGNFVFNNLCGYLKVGEAQDHSIAEVVLFNGTQNSTNIEAIEQFLYCRWFGGGPNEGNNFCIPR